MYLDRMTGALNQRVSPLGRRALAKAQAALGGLKFLQLEARHRRSPWSVWSSSRCSPAA